MPTQTVSRACVPLRRLADCFPVQAPPPKDDPKPLVSDRVLLTALTLKKDAEAVECRKKIHDILLGVPADDNEDRLARDLCRIRAVDPKNKHTDGYWRAAEDVEKMLDEAYAEYRKRGEKADGEGNRAEQAHATREGGSWGDAVTETMPVKNARLARGKGAASTAVMQAREEQLENRRKGKLIFWSDCSAS